MNYTPGMCATVRDKHDARRDMTADEILSAHAWLTARCAPVNAR